MYNSGVQARLPRRNVSEAAYRRLNMIMFVRVVRYPVGEIIDSSISADPVERSDK